MRKCFIPVLVIILLAFSAREARAAVPWSKKGVGYFPPALQVSGGGGWSGYWPGGFNGLYVELLNNLRMPEGPFKTRFAQPGPAFKSDAYLWDTAFIAQVWKPWDVKTAQEITFAILDHADQGRLRHVYSAAEYSPLTQPPLMAWSVWELYVWSQDRAYLARAYPVLKDYNHWLYANRTLPGGLFFWKHADESGLDNAPRFTAADTKPIIKIETLAAVDLSSYMVVDNESLAKMAEALGKPNEAALFQKQAAELKDLMNSKLYDPETGYYYDRDMAADKLLKIKTIASLLPLFAGIPDPARAQVLRDHVMNEKEFNSPFPLPSVALDDPTFEKDMWRGPVWINTAYMVILGLERYGFSVEAAELSFKVADGVFRNHQLTGDYFEFYDPTKDGIKELHREGNGGKLFARGDKPKDHFVGWTGLAGNLVIEHLVGFHKTAGQRWIQPRFPASAQGATIKLAIPQEGLDLELTLNPGGKITGKYGMVGISMPFAVDQGKPMAITY